MDVALEMMINQITKHVDKIKITPFPKILEITIENLTKVLLSVTAKATLQALKLNSGN